MNPDIKKRLVTLEAENCALKQEVAALKQSIADGYLATSCRGLTADGY